MKGYPRAFYDHERDESARSARVMVPLVLQYVNPESVVDVGCGAGAFLAEFKRAGVTRVLGMEGPWLDRARLLVDSSEVVNLDLRLPSLIGRSFDLVVSLEVGEHLPARYAEGYVGFLCSLGPLILFSAAVPFQGGQDHANERWPNYWARLFSHFGYTFVDCLRPNPTLWNSSEVAACYAQNTIFYVNRTRLHDYPALLKRHDPQEEMPVALVHPRIYSAHQAILSGMRSLPRLIGQTWMFKVRGQRYFEQRTRELSTDDLLLDK